MVKLIQYLQERYPDVSARKLKKAIEQQGCRVNGKIETIASRPLMPGDKVDFHLPFRQESPTFEKVNILYEDKELIAYNKQAGLTCEEKNFAPYLLIHRLDKDTSGVLLLAKTEEVKKAMIELFREKRVKKSYLAIVAGLPAAAKGKIKNHLAKIGTLGGQAIWGSVPSDKGDLAETVWTLEAKGNHAALLLCHPITGRTHQLRVHLSEMGHPILGDPIYGRNISQPYFAPRSLLHALTIEFPHPKTQHPCTFSAPIPVDFEEALKACKF